MVADIRIKRGLNINMSGQPVREITDASAAKTISVYPSEIEGIKPRLLVEEGTKVLRGTALLYDKKHPEFKFCSPVAGTVKRVILGARRSLQEITIEVAGRDGAESFKKYGGVDALLSAKRADLLTLLQNSGLLLLIRQRPFGKMADASVLPKSIFVNAMANAPYRVDPSVVVQGREAEFQAGLNALTRLTDGEVHLCTDGNGVDVHPAIAGAKNVRSSAFSGPHPSGNTSTHIHRLDPIAPGDAVWTVSAVNLIQIGELLLEGKVPATKYVVAGGPGLNKSSARYYKVRIGTPISDFLGGALGEDTRLVSGDVYCGTAIAPDSGVRYFDTSLCVLAEDRDRRFMGWLAPGVNLFSTHRVFLSRWFNADRSWDLTTSKRGSDRAMVLTGICDKYVPLNIMVDYLARACLANDTEEAVKLGILETAAEDFALCSIVCPSKTDYSAIIQRGLDSIEKEGL
jgi:Na+-transporting NADH:ubiquinone oxidoreductase subunit A